MENIKQNKNSSVIFNTFRVILFFILYISLVLLYSYPFVFADSLSILPSSGNSVWMDFAYRYYYYSEYDIVLCLISNSPYNSQLYVSTSPNAIVTYEYNGSLHSASLSSYNSEYNLYYLYTTANNGPRSWSDNISVFSDFDSAISSISSFFGSISSGSAVMIPSQSWLYLGTNSLNQSVFLQSVYENNAAVCFYSEDGVDGLIPAVVAKNNYGVIARIAGDEYSLNSSELVIDGVTWYDKYRTSSDFLITTANPDIGVRSSSTVAQDADIDAINAAFPSGGRQNLNYSLPGGNMAFIQISDYTTIAQALVNFDTPVSTSNYNRFNMRYGWVSSLPESSEDLPDYITLSFIPWSPAGPTDLLGRFSMGQASFDTSGHSGDYLVIFNPWGSDVQADTLGTSFANYVNPAITLSVDNISRMRVFGLHSQYNPSTGTFDDSGNGSYYDRDMSSNGNDFIDNNGQPNAPVQGGGSNSSPVNNFWQWLDGKFESLKNLFATGHDTIQTLIGYGSDFMTSVHRLYTWLPDSVYSVLCSALVLVIIIGVVKVFI